MTGQDATPAEPRLETVPRPGPDRLRAWRRALLVAFVLFAGLSWLLVRLVWLPFYFGLFFYLVAGLLVSAAVFRMARPARPLSTKTLLVGVVLVAFSVWIVSIVWEYRDRAAGVGQYPRFAAARAAAQASGRPIVEVERAATDRFQEALREHYPPGGPIGYARWATRSGELKLSVDGATDTVTLSQRGIAWPIRSLASILLMATGLWFGFEALRSPTPVSNFLVPGQEAEEEDD